MFFNQAVLSVLSIDRRLPLSWAHLERLAPDLWATWLIFPWMESMHGFALAMAGEFIDLCAYAFLCALLL